MNKRLRKKKHRGEYRQFGFAVVCQFRDQLSHEDFDRFLDDFISQIENLSLATGGGGSPELGLNFVVQREHRFASTDEADRVAVLNWLQAHPEVVDPRVSDFFDLWYGKDPFDE